MTESIADGVFTANVATAGNAWDVSLKQNLTLTSDVDYVLSFSARSDEGRTLIAGLGLDGDPWTNATETVTITSDWMTYTIALTSAGFGGEGNRLFFDMGADAGQVQLDNISFVVGTQDPISANSGDSAWLKQITEMVSDVFSGAGLN
jgi:hypothetical protein